MRHLQHELYRMGSLVADVNDGVEALGIEVFLDQLVKWDVRWVRVRQRSALERHFLERFADGSRAPTLLQQGQRSERGGDRISTHHVHHRAPARPSHVSSLRKGCDRAADIAGAVAAAVAASSLAATSFATARTHIARGDTARRTHVARGDTARV